MKILLVNRYAYPKYGSETYFLNLYRLLKKKGHKVIVFTVKDERNITKEYGDYFMGKVETDNFNFPSLGKMLSAPSTVYSFEAKQRIEELIKDSKPDIAHLHNIKRLISPSILHSIKKFGVPIVYTLHDYHLICPNYRLFSKGKICEACRENKYYNSFFKRCVRDSWSFSLLACIEQYVHSALKIFKNNVDMFIAPSEFLRDKMIEFGFKAEKITRIPYFIFPDDYYPESSFFNYIVYCGRIVSEKGILTIIQAMRDFPSLRLLILGEGERRKELEGIIAKERITNIEFKGYMSEDSIKEILKNAMFTVIPSQWQEVFGIVIIESFAMGKPVVGADIGGIPEVIENNVSGLLFKPGDTVDLVNRIRYLLDNENQRKEMGDNARKIAVEDYNQENHYEKLIKIYQDLSNKG